MRDENLSRTSDFVARAPSLMKTVLLVEDDLIIVDLLRQVLMGAGYEVLVSGNAQEALENFQEYLGEILCVVLDYEIPGMHPKRLLERFLELDGGVRVILSSGYPQSYIAREFPIESLFGYLPKPYEPQLLILELEKMRRTSP